MPENLPRIRLYQRGESSNLANLKFMLFTFLFYDCANTAISGQNLQKYIIAFSLLDSGLLERPLLFYIKKFDSVILF